MLISVTVKPNSKKGPLVVNNPDGSLTVFLREKPHDGEANTALLKLLADHFSVPKTSLKLKSGATSRHKLIEF